MTMKAKEVQDDAKENSHVFAHIWPKPGDIYRHYKGGFYAIVACGIMADSLEQMVVYRSNKNGKVWIRLARDFHTMIETRDKHDYLTLIPRFLKVHD